MKFSILKKSIQLVWQSSKKWNAAKMIIVLVQGVIPVAILYLMKILIDKIIEVDFKSLEALYQHQFIIVLGFIILLNALNSVLSVFQNLVNEIQQQYFTDYIQIKIHKKFSQIDYALFEDSEAQDLFHKAQKDGLIRPNMIIQAMTVIVQNLITLGGISILLYSLHIFILPILLIIMLPTSLVHSKFSKKKNNWELEKSHLNRRSFYLSHLLKDIQYAKEIRIFNFFEGFEKSFMGIRKQLLHGKMELSKLQAKYLLLTNIVESLVLGAMYYYTIYQSISGAISIGSLVMYFQAFQRGQTSLKASLKGVSELLEHRLFLVQLFEFLELESKVVIIQNPISFPKKVNSLALRNVSFQYEKSNNLILDNLNINFKSGQITAIVGENGSGKSTLSNLICRIYEPTSGVISINDIEYPKMTINEVRENTSNVFQDYSRFYLQAKQNITGSADSYSELGMGKSLKYSSADKVIEKLPYGVDNFLGRHYDANGSELSGGEWQRISIARAYYKNSPIIILDEPTTFIDGIMEKQFLESLHQLKKDKIIILISHKVSNIKIADKVILMKEGRIIDQGKHDSLLERNRYYSYLLNLKKK